MTLHLSRIGQTVAACVLSFALACAQAGSPPPEVQRSVRASTFEVVLHKAEADPLSYEKPLPLDLVPYLIRKDAYWPIGTAFAVAPDRYVSAGHVLLSTVGSQFGAPSIRDSAGHVYAIDRILAFSAHEDFVVFSVAGAPPANPLPVSSDRTVDSVVYAVGNALGEGVVIRDGLLTSETPEQQDGRWNWLRFSAAASPGNSGGPLLDADGRVIGIVEAKSPNENLNYALPIERALAAVGKPGSVDVRYSTKLPVSRASEVSSVKASLALPSRFADFSREYLALVRKSTRDDLERLQASQNTSLFPAGNARKLLSAVYDSLVPSFVQQQEDDSWDARAASGQKTITLDGHGLVTTASDLNVAVFRLRRPGSASDDAFYGDSRASMDLLLKGLQLSRPVGTQAIRITSLGSARSEETHADRFGRRWQVRSWPLGFADQYVVAFELPVPEGYMGFAVEIPATQLETQSAIGKLLCDYFDVSYSGTGAQWAAFLRRAALRPTAFERLRLEAAPGKEFVLESPRLKLHVPREAFRLPGEGTIVLDMAYYLDGARVTWDIGAVHLYADERQRSYVSLQRHPKPAAGADAEEKDTWSRLSTRGVGYNGIANHDADYQNYWIRDIVPPGQGHLADAAVLYEIGLGTDTRSLPRDLEESLALIRGGTQVLEH